MDLLNGFYGIVKKDPGARLENEIKEYFGTKYVFLMSSGKAALFLIVSGLNKLTGRTKVIIPAYTCFSVPSAIRMAGLEIVLCDIRPDTLDYEYSQLEDLLEDDILCIVSTHLFGIPSDTDRIRDLCRSKGIYVVEDAAQAMGVINKGKKLATLGDVGFFSLGRGKNITCGSGGVIITSDERIAGSIRECGSGIQRVPFFEYVKDIAEIIFLMIFINPFLYWFPKGLPFLKLGETKFYRTFPVQRLTGFKVGLLRNWRNKLETLNKTRSAVAGYYLQSLGLKGRMPIYSNGFAYLRFPVFLHGKTAKEKLCNTADWLGISPMYPTQISKIADIKDLFGNPMDACAEKIAESLVALPTHVFLTEKDKESISNALKEMACI